MLPEDAARFSVVAGPLLDGGRLSDPPEKGIPSRMSRLRNPLW